jgi:transcriptional regulator with XRE-family HTH domain
MKPSMGGPWLPSGNSTTKHSPRTLIIIRNDHRLPHERSLDVSDEPSSVQSQDRNVQESDQLAQHTLDYLDVLNGSRDVLPQLDDLTAAQRAQVLAAWGTVDRLVAIDPPPELEADPTAVALGVVPVSPLDPAALRRARQHRKLRPSDIAASLRARGWSMSTSEVFTWERRSEDISPALLADLASALDVSKDSLVLSAGGATAVGVDESDDAAQTFLQALYSDELDEVVQQWAQAFELGPSAARQDLQRRLSNAAHRGQRTLTPRQWKAVVWVLLASERSRRGLPDNPVTSE